MALSPPRDDLYADLGVERGATADEVNAAFRARAKDLHPDAQPGDADALEQFKRVSHAYTVLRDPVSRARYDARAAADPFVAPSPTPSPVPTVRTPSAPVPPPRWQLGVRGARWAVGGGFALVIVGILAGALVVGLQRADADLRARGVATEAVVVEVNGARKLEFTTGAGNTIRAAESTKSGVEEPAVRSRVAIHYDRNDPTHVVADTSHLARDVTLWIVAVKLVVGGTVLVAMGVRRLRRVEAREVRN
ncbi:MAG: J domain-containing protein [Acidimicrobiia bacterium]